MLGLCAAQLGYKSLAIHSFSPTHVVPDWLLSIKWRLSFLGASRKCHGYWEATLLFQIINVTLHGKKIKPLFVYPKQLSIQTTHCFPRSCPILCQLRLWNQVLDQFNNAEGIFVCACFWLIIALKLLPLLGTWFRKPFTVHNNHLIELLTYSQCYILLCTSKWCSLYYFSSYIYTYTQSSLSFIWHSHSNQHKKHLPKWASGTGDLFSLSLQPVSLP